MSDEYYVPGVDEQDPKKTIMSLQQAHEKTAANAEDIADNTADIATNAANIATNTTNIATNTSNISALQTKTNGYESAWTAWVPTVTAGSGTFTTLGTITARYKQIGKTVFFYIAIPITTNGTAASSVRATLPATAANTVAQTANGRETTSTGKALSSFIAANTTTLQTTFFDGTYPGADGATISISGHYEST